MARSHLAANREERVPRQENLAKAYRQTASHGDHLGDSDGKVASKNAILAQSNAASSNLEEEKKYAPNDDVMS